MKYKTTFIINYSRKFVLIFFLLLFNFSLSAQDFFIENDSLVFTGKGSFYDGDSIGDYVGYKNQSIIFRTNNYLFLHFTFTEFDLDSTASLNIYEITGKRQKILIGKYSGNNIPDKISAQIIVFEYYAPKNGKRKNHSGWIANFVTKEYPILLNGTKDPASDCIGAIPLCNNNNAIALAGQYTDVGVINDEQGSCIGGTGSGGSVWYTFSPQTTGQIGFDLIPNASDDYDFVLYDAVNGCSNLTEMSCNYSLEAVSTGITFTTSNYQDSYDTWSYPDCGGWDYYSGDADCGPWNEPENVTAGNTYVLMINFYSGSNGGFNLNFTGVTITDNTAPSILSTSQLTCNGSVITVNFSEQIDCTTINNSDFSITGYTVTVSNNNCTSGMTNSIDLNVVPVLPIGTYTLSIQGLFDMCGNELIGNSSIVISSASLTSNATGTDFCAGQSTSINGNASGSGTLTYNWNSGQSTENFSVNMAGTYTITVSDACGTTSTSSVTVNQLPNPVTGGVTVICNNGGADADLSTGNIPDAIEWFEWGPMSVTNAAQCNTCGGVASYNIFGFYQSCSVVSCDVWFSLGTSNVINEASTFATQYMVVVENTTSGCTTQETFSIGCNPLPIELLNFYAKPHNNVVEIAWSTITETNNNYFIVERSLNGVDFEQIDIVNGSENSNYELNYSAVDLQPIMGILYYRLKQVDFDGNHTYSEIITTNFNITETSFIVYPSPVSDNFTVEINHGHLNEVEIKIIDMLNREIKSETIHLNNKIIRKVFYNDYILGGVYSIILIDKKTGSIIAKDKIVFTGNSKH